MELPSIILNLSDNRFNDVKRRSLDDLTFLYIGDSQLVDEKINKSFEMGINAFYVEEEGPSFDLAVEKLRQYPRESYFLVSSIADPEKSLEIINTPLQYYDLLLYRLDKLVTIDDPETFYFQLTDDWEKMTSFLSQGFTKAIGVENFYDNHYLSLFQIIAQTGLSSAQANLLVYHPYAQDPDLLALMHSFRVPVIAKIPTFLVDKTNLAYLENQGITSFLLDEPIFLPSPKEIPELREVNENRFFDISAEAAFYHNQVWGKGLPGEEIDIISSPEEEI